MERDPALLLIESSRLRIEDLPDAADEGAVADFSLSFNGYQHFGSFQAAADAATAQKRETLDDLRNELFVAFRASNHCMNDLFLETYRELLPHLKHAITRENGGAAAIQP